MSFSGEIKEELARHYASARHCQLAELAALLNFCGQYGQIGEDSYTVGFQTENEAVAHKGLLLMQKAFRTEAGELLNGEQMQEFIQKFGDLSQPVSPLFLKNACCQRSFFLRP